MTKQKAKELCKDILYSYKIDSKIESDDLKFLLKIFEQHQDWDIKQGIGINYITVKKADFGTRCFYIYRLDGTSTDISYLKSITNPSKIQVIYTACRNSIIDLIDDFRNRNVIFGKSICPFTNEVLYKHNTHIDHYDLKFKDLIDEWLKDRDIDALYKNTNPTKDNSTLTLFESDKITKDFIKFHNNNTHLRFVSRFANLSILR